MGGSKERAGLFIVDSAGNTCCLIRSLPYDKEMYRWRRYNKQKQHKTHPVERRCNRAMQHTSEETSMDGTGIKMDAVDEAKEGHESNVETVTSSTITSKQGEVRRPRRLHRIRPNAYDEFSRTEQLRKRWPSFVLPHPFLEMIQIPRGMKERCDKDLMQTAVREFREETLCANSPLHVQDDPITLYWFDDGKRWTYTIYIATVQSRLYFAFDTSVMARAELSVLGDNDTPQSYRIYTTVVSRCKYTKMTNRLVVMKISDYVHYMCNHQLSYYGDNNYIELFGRIVGSVPKTMPLNVFPFSVGKQHDTTKTEYKLQHSMSSLSSLVSGNFIEQTHGAVTIVTSDMFADIKNDAEGYVNGFDPSVFSLMNENRQMNRLWSCFWLAETNNRPTHKGVYTAYKSSSECFIY